MYIDFGNYTDFKTAMDALKVLEEIVYEYGYVTVNDVLDIVGIGIHQTSDDANMGWSDLCFAHVRYSFDDDAWHIAMRKPKYLNRDNIICTRKRRGSW